MHVLFCFVCHAVSNEHTRRIARPTDCCPAQWARAANRKTRVCETNGSQSTARTRPYVTAILVCLFGRPAYLSVEDKEDYAFTRAIVDNTPMKEKLLNNPELFDVWKTLTCIT